MKKVVAGKLFWRRTQVKRILIAWRANFLPFPNMLQHDTSVDECLCQRSSIRSEGVGAEDNRSRGLVSFEEVEGFGRGEEVEQLRREELVVAVVDANVFEELLSVC